MDKIEKYRYFDLARDLRHNKLKSIDEAEFRRLEKEHKKKIVKDDKDIKKFFSIISFSFLVFGNFLLFLILGGAFVLSNGKNYLLLGLLVIQMLNCIYWSYGYIKGCV